MKAKLTLSVEPETITAVKRMARRQGVSVSALFEQWSRQTTSQEGREPTEALLAGLWKDAADPDIDDAKLQAMLEKHVR